MKSSAIVGEIDRLVIGVLTTEFRNSFWSGPMESTRSMGHARQSWPLALDNLENTGVLLETSDGRRVEAI